MSSSSGTDASYEEEDEENSNYAHFRDCLSTTLLRPPPTTQHQHPTKSRRRGKATTKPNSSSSLTTGNRVEDAAELAEFTDYLATEIFENLPQDLQDLDYRSWRDSQGLQSQYALPLTTSSLAELNLPPHVTETLETYNLIATPDDSGQSTLLPSSPESFLLPIITAYLEPLITPPPATTATRTEACEICGRWWINLSYHHLIPRFVHDKVVKRGWHRKEDLQNVAWLCGACHRFVHQFRGHEDLARDYYTVDLLLEDEQVQKWAKWVGKMRWKGGGGRRRVLK
ncbi:uncharacterized protein F5Z01DRAFT_299916 [Emericellopsis atlantica]|uniref:HNH domain-containing protein n=1 Tax=Emericellopsis atlantica TaxID=2614577 RepID=A0A9P8CL34_9HYPO|nr:uncharacterized protein F5Z01DRAFT_299916 [Emericellopsis atlantica]KAG9251204.1 hypothetical protein F5Z01DRAFT_299916 [Emericellopsis atlantica]